MAKNFWIEAASAERVAEAAALAAQAWDVPPEESLVEDWGEDTIVLIAVERQPGMRVVGVTTARLVGGDVALSDETVVDPTWQGQGVARALLDAMVFVLGRRGITRLRGQSSLERPESLAFFRRYGFEVTDVVVARDMPGFADGTRVAITELDIAHGELRPEA